MALGTAHQAGPQTDQSTQFPGFSSGRRVYHPSRDDETSVLIKVELSANDPSPSPERPRCDVGFQPRRGNQWLTGCPLISGISLDLARSRPSSAIHSYHRLAKSGPDSWGSCHNTSRRPAKAMKPRPLIPSHRLGMRKHVPWESRPQMIDSRQPQTDDSFVLEHNCPAASSGFGADSSSCRTAEEEACMESFHAQSFSHRHASVIRQLLAGRN